MSGGRRFRRRVQRGRLEARLRELDRAVPEFVSTRGELEAWKVGTALMLVPALREDWPVDLRNIVVCRREATLNGRCCCGARRRFKGVDAESVAHVRFLHEADCIAGDDAEILRRIAE